MLHIVCPYDFSQQASNAVKYAASMLKKHKAQITILHVLKKTLGDSANIELKTRLKYSVTAYKAVAGSETTVSYKILQGEHINDAVRNFVLENSVDLIILGTSEKDPMAKFLYGSNTDKILLKPICPVLAIPPKYYFSGFKNVVYSSDNYSIQNEILKILNLISSFEPKINIVHVQQEYVPEPLNTRKLETDIKNKFDYPNIHFVAITNPSVENGIVNFINNNKPDLLIMFTSNYKSGFLGMFTSSVTQNMTSHLNIPVLVFGKEPI